MQEKKDQEPQCTGMARRFSSLRQSAAAPEKKALAVPPVLSMPASQSCAAETPCFAVSKAPVSIPGNGR